MENTNESSNFKNINLEVVNYILESTLITSEFLNIKEIKEIKFLPSKQGYTIEVKSKDEKTYYMGISEYGYVEVVRENSIDGNIVYMPDDDYKIDEIQIDNKSIHTKEEMPWLDYLEIDDNTLERHIIKEKTPKDIFNKYLKSDNYIIISSTGHFSHKKFNECLVDLKENKIYNVSYDTNAKEEFEYYKDLTDDQKQKLIKYISENDLLNSSINVTVFDASDTIEIMMRGEHNIIRNASKEFTNNEMHIFDDIVDIVFNDNTLDKIKNFFDFGLKSNSKEQNDIDDKEISKFARQNGYEGIKYISKWKNYDLYSPYMNQIYPIGFNFILVKNNDIRMATENEVSQINDDINDTIEEFNKIYSQLLNRQQLIEMKKKFMSDKSSVLEHPEKLYINFLNNLENKLKEYKFEDDDRFCSAYALPDKWLSFDDAINYLFDNISGNIIIKLSEVPSGSNIMEIQKIQDDYYKDGIICKHEKDLILKLIKDIRYYFISGETEERTKKDIKTIYDDIFKKIDNNQKKNSDEDNSINNNG